MRDVFHLLEVGHQVRNERCGRKSQIQMLNVDAVSKGKEEARLNVKTWINEKRGLRDRCLGCHMLLCERIL